MRISVIVVICVLVGCQADRQTNPSKIGTGTLARLSEPLAGTTMHESSWDRSGGNADFRTVQPGQTITLLDYKGAGTIGRFWCTIAPRSDLKLHRQVILRMYWDGETVPSVECPIGDFFGVGFGQQVDYISLPLNETSGGYNCYWPMPFCKSARWTLTNLSDKRLDSFYYNIDFRALDSLPDDTRHFRAQWRRENPTDPKRNYTVLDTVGQGHFVGAAMFMQSRNPRGIGFLEGDEMIYIDGSPEPAVIGTGTEDYFSSGWYYDRGTYSAPYHGVNIKSESDSRISTYRWHIEDAMPYRRSMRVTIEHGHGNSFEADYSSVAFYYESGPNRSPAPIPADPAKLLPGTPPKPMKIAGAIEAESLLDSAVVTGGKIENQHMLWYGNHWSDDRQIWWHDTTTGQSLKLKVPVKEAGLYEVILHMTKAPDYATVAIRLGDTAPLNFDGFDEHVIASGPVSIGRMQLEPGNLPLEVTITGASEQSSGTMVGIDAIELRKL